MPFYNLRPSLVSGLAQEVREENKPGISRQSLVVPHEPFYPRYLPEFIKVGAAVSAACSSTA